MTAPAQKLAILLWAAEPERPELCAAPFVYATTAAAIDCDVEMHFSGRNVRLLVQSVAAGLVANHEQNTTLYHFMRQAADLGVRFFACAMSVKTHLSDSDILIPEYAGTAGAGAFTARVLDPAWRTLVF